MSQHDYALANASGASFRADANNALAAVVSLNSGASAPATTFAYMLWADTTSGWLKQRDAANSAWILREPLGTGAAVDIASAATLDLTANAASSNTLRVTGTTTTTAITLADGQHRLLRAAAAWPITHGASLICPGSANYTCAAGDMVMAVGEATGVVRLMIWKADGTAVVGGDSRIVQVVEATPYATYDSTSTVIPYDDTVPQSGEGKQFNSVTITPTSASNRLRVEVDYDFVMSSGADTCIMALFQDATAGALAATATYLPGSYQDALHLAYEMAAGTTSATTFKTRAGMGAATLYVNGDTGARKLGGVAAVRMRVTEIAV